MERDVDTPLAADGVPLPALPRVDERDTMFARMARRRGTWQYDDTYARRPELKVTDDRLRSLPPLCAPGGRHYDSVVSREADRWFAAIDAITVDEGVVAAWMPRIGGGSGDAETLAALAAELGAVAAGCCAVDESYGYTVKGRQDDDYGRVLGRPLPFAVVFLVEMDHTAMRCAPRAPTIRESALQYYRAAVISKTIAAVLRGSGFAATPHFDAHYEVILPPLAVAAGLGELGRNNILVADRYGSRVRIGAVTTDLALPPAPAAGLGVRHFCSVCRKCADNCPAGALSYGEPGSAEQAGKWSTHVEACYGYWRWAGTDCGICMAVCPYSHPDTWPHAMVRAVARRFPALHRLLVWGDDVLYGRRWRPRGG